MNYLNREKGLASEVEGVLLDILTADDGNDPSSPTGGAAPQLSERIMLLWFDEYEAVGKSYDVVADFKQKQLRRTLVSELERLRKDVERLSESERNYQAKETERQATVTHAAEADSRAELLEMKLKAHESDVQKTHDTYKSQITELNTKLQEALQAGVGRNIEGLKAQFDTALAASREQQVEFKSRIAELTKKNSALQATILELQSTISNLSKPDAHPPADPEVDVSSDSGSPLSYRNRQRRKLSEPEAFEPTSYNATPPLEPFNTSISMGSLGRRPSTPLPSDAVSAGKGSPTAERYFGRGKFSHIIGCQLVWSYANRSRWCTKYSQG
ncbi:hypothetical protein M426DRAFT_201437 [Hypoxylon sp. CI-4A]|nr:hypothetical protein M426DRAFT_201437 [Hypoxylon sp. CI-4A]